MLTSNLTIRPNVFPRKDTDVSNDKRFIAQVRGRRALLKLLDHIRPGGRIEDAGDMGLSHRQLAELAWDLPCSDCGCNSLGPVLKDGKEVIEFRCPRGSCENEPLVGRMVLLPLRLVEQAIEREGRTLSEIVKDALTVYEQGYKLPLVNFDEQRPFPVRLTLTQSILLSDGEIRDAVRAWVGAN